MPASMATYLTNMDVNYALRMSQTVRSSNDHLYLVLLYNIS